MEKKDDTIAVKNHRLDTKNGKYVQRNSVSAENFKDLKDRHFSAYRGFKHDNVYTRETFYELKKKFL